MHRSNGLIDDFVVYGSPSDYVSFAEHVQAAFASSEPLTLKTASPIQIEISKATETGELFTSLQNESDFYATADEWAKRDILRVRGSLPVLESLRAFLIDLSGRGDGYSYISEYSANFAYSDQSPQWRLHVQVA
jgi:hypothetical protein